MAKLRRGYGKTYRQHPEINTIRMVLESFEACGNLDKEDLPIIIKFRANEKPSLVKRLVS